MSIESLQTNGTKHLNTLSFLERRHPTSKVRASKNDKAALCQRKVRNTQLTERTKCTINQLKIAKALPTPKSKNKNKTLLHQQQWSATWRIHVGGGPGRLRRMVCAMSHLPGPKPAQIPYQLDATFDIHFGGQWLWACASPAVGLGDGLGRRWQRPTPRLPSPNTNNHKNQDNKKTLQFVIEMGMSHVQCKRVSENLENVKRYESQCVLEKQAWAGKVHTLKMLSDLCENI